MVLEQHIAVLEDADATADADAPTELAGVDAGTGVEPNADARIGVQRADVRMLGWQVQGTFDVIVDKATLDAVACALTAIEDVELLLLGAARRLAPGAVLPPPIWRRPRPSWTTASAS